MLRTAINAIAQGDRARARDLLTRLLRADQTNASYWLWMSAVVENRKERIYCLRNALRLDPANQLAHLGLLLFGMLKSDGQKKPSAIIYRDWSAQFHRSDRNREPRARYTRLIAGFLIFLLVGILTIVYSSSRSGARLFSSKPHFTITPRFDGYQASPTLLPTNTPWKITSTPMSHGPISLEEMLQATYTPTPLYVNTPHPISEAYRAGIRAFNEGDLEEMLRYMQQAARDEPDSADTTYYVGEAYRMLGDNQRAINAYTQAIQIKPDFAPAYLGRARVNISLGDLKAAEEDLQAAIMYDPEMVEAPVELVGLYIQVEDYDAALTILERYESKASALPMLQYHYSQIALARGEPQTALDHARKAYELDFTFLPTYLILGQAFVAVGDPESAIVYLETYLRFQRKDSLAWLTLGEAIYASGGNYEECISATTAALEDENYKFKALLYRGLCYLELGEGQSAINDFSAARKLDRNSFDACLGLGRGLILTNRMVEAISQISVALDLANNDHQRAEVYYWRSIAYKSLGNIRQAARDWELLLTLPDDSVPQQWRHEVRRYLLFLTPSPTSSPTLPPVTTLSLTPYKTPAITATSP